jgi:hypothetical protein
MNYYDSSLLIYSEEVLYSYSLITNTWTHKVSLSQRKTQLIDYSQCIYKDTLYLIMGWDNLLASATHSIFKINLKNENYEVNEVPISNEGVAEWLFGYNCVDNIVYQFGGGSTEEGYFNSLFIFDLDQTIPEFKILNENKNVPRARRGHGMEIYDDKIYIFGGVDSNGER